MDVIGPLDHDGFVRSIYFWDPNGIRMEFAYTCETPEQAKASAAAARARLDRWVKERRGYDASAGWRETYR